MTIIAEAFANWQPRRERYESYKYPYRYAGAYLAENLDMAPAEITQRVEERIRAMPNAKGEKRKKRHDREVIARAVLDAWLEESGEDEDDACRLLAEAYLSEHRIEAPPERGGV
ncbi:hypothetical protein AB0M28_14195 [Streptomyces sp. NPDC051940]|uniref:hypothetical protein n=1 Tax=Streptomyces sp. NPDC051940 TaxID=3155675 RepID=UPI0034128014